MNSNDRCPPKNLAFEAGLDPKITRFSLFESPMGDYAFIVARGDPEGEFREGEVVVFDNLEEDNDVRLLSHVGKIDNVDEFVSGPGFAYDKIFMWTSLEKK